MSKYFSGFANVSFFHHTGKVTLEMLSTGVPLLTRMVTMSSFANKGFCQLLAYQVVLVKSERCLSPSVLNVTSDPSILCV